MTVSRSVQVPMALLLLAVTFACGDGTASRSDAAADSGSTGGEKLAPELVGISSWINSEPFTLESQRGKVVLLDIWTYTCINCIRTFPYLKAWHEKYSDEGLVIIGVHSPEFEFEKEYENVAAAAKEFGLEYPIVQDNDFEMFDALENRFWPAKYLVDKDGYIRYSHFGEGEYLETEEKIRELLMETGAAVSQIATDHTAEPEIDPAARQRDRARALTRELYAGYERNYGAIRVRRQPYVRHEEFYRQEDVAAAYEDPGDHENQYIYLHGLWRNGPESLTHARDTAAFEDYMAIKFFATTVNVVMSTESGTPYEVRVTMDGRPLDSVEAGADVKFDDGGNSYILVDRPDMYRLVKLSEFSGHELKLSSNSSDFSVFAFTFGAYMDPPALNLRVGHTSGTPDAVGGRL